MGKHFEIFQPFCKTDILYKSLKNKHLQGENIKHKICLIIILIEYFWLNFSINIFSSDVVWSAYSTLKKISKSIKNLWESLFSESSSGDPRFLSDFRLDFS